MAQTWQLKWNSPRSGPPLHVGPGVHILGSSADADLRVVDPTVSRRHVRLSCDDQGVTIEDLGSTNGSAVNGEKFDGPTLVTAPGKLKVGAVVFDLQPLQPANRPAVSPADEISSGASVLLGPATVGFLRDAGEEVAFREGEVVVRRGDHQDFFYVVISGEVELLLTEGQSRKRPLARLGEGGIFGAESVLGKEGAAIDAIAATDVRLLRYPASALPSALQESASLRRKLLGGIARNLHKTTSDALDLLRGADVIARLVQGDSDPDALIAVSPRMKSIQRKIGALAEVKNPVLILGEDGTGKTQIARLIHDASERSSGPLIAVNCRDLTPGHAAELILGEDLGGRLPSGDHASGGIHLAHDGTLVLRGADVLEPAVQKMIAAHMRTEQNRGRNSYPDTRIIMTARAASKKDVLGGVAPELEECFDEILEIPPLGKRPKDIMPLAMEFLSRHGPEPPVITEGARHALLSLRYQRRNVAELREVLELAVRIADGPEIRAEHIFGGVGEDAAPPGLDISSSSLIQGLISKPVLPVLRWITLGGFAAVIALCLAAASSASGRVANTAIWSAWEPVVFCLFLVIGPIWCTICPLSTAARFSKRLGASDRPPPAWLMKHGPWLAIIGFALIIWVERVFNSAENPVASGILLISLIVSAVLGALLFRREVWCRHLCPLGRLATTLAPASPLQVTAKQQVCASTCTTHSCYKGTDDIPGCTVFHHPLEGRQAYRCKLCLDCLQSCPHHSAQLQIRAPLIGVWRLDASATDLAMFASAITLFALATVASRTFEILSQPIHFTILCILALATGIAIHHTVMAVASTDRRIEQMIRLAVALMILGWSALMVSQLANIVVLNQARIVLNPPQWLPAWVPPDLSLLLVLQIGIVVTAFGFAMVALNQIRFNKTTVWTTLGRHLIPLLFVGYAAAVVALLII